MIIVKLIGGLGNQFFQYALGRHLSIKNNTALKLDVSGFETYSLRRYTLQHFNVIEDTASAEDLAAFQRAESNRLRHHLSRAGLLPYSQRFMTVTEKSFRFDPRVLELPGNLMLDGYWQSEKYFAGIGDVIRSELTLRDRASPAAAKTARAIADSDSISLHVRRGDYISNATIHEVATPEYYQTAMNELTRVVGAPHFFVFSDDPQWARENLAFDCPVTFVSDDADSKDYEELWLMSQCKHHVIANSSFSWWGAWLGANAQKTVFAPKLWFRDNLHNTSDLIPESWRMI